MILRNRAPTPATQIGSRDHNFGLIALLSSCLPPGAPASGSDRGRRGQVLGQTPDPPSPGGFTTRHRRPATRQGRPPHRAGRGRADGCAPGEGPRRRRGHREIGPDGRRGALPHRGPAPGRPSPLRLGGGLLPVPAGASHRARGRALTVRLSEGTTAYSETVTVTPDVFRAPVDPVPSATSWAAPNSSTCAGSSPTIRSGPCKSCPGSRPATTCAASSPSAAATSAHLTFTVDGFATPYLLHTVRGVEDRGPTGRSR